MEFSLLTPERLVTSKLRLMYGKDPWADDDMSLIVLDADVVKILRQLESAETWGEVVEAWPDALDERNEWQEYLGKPPVKAEDEFDFRSESMPDKGLVYLASLSADSNAAEAISRLTSGQLTDDIRFETGIDCFQCYLRDDECAARLLELLRERYGNKVSLVRDDSEVAYIQEGLFGVERHLPA